MDQSSYDDTGRQGQDDSSMPADGAPSYIPPPPRPQKGFNWLACCGISCGVIVVIGIIIGVIIANSFKDMAKSFEQVEAVAQEVQTASFESIRDNAETVTAFQLSTSPEVYQSKWVRLEGVTSDPFDAQMQQDGSVQGTQYFMGNNIFITDVSGTGQVADTGESIVAWGKPGVIEMTAMPLFGPIIEMAMKANPDVPDLSTLVFFYAKKVEVVGGATDKGNPCDDGDSTEDLSDRPPRDSSGEDTGWIR